MIKAVWALNHSVVNALSQGTDVLQGFGLAWNASKGAAAGPAAAVNSPPENRPCRHGEAWPTAAAPGRNSDRPAGN